MVGVGPWFSELVCLTAEASSCYWVPHSPSWWTGPLPSFLRSPFTQGEDQGKEATGVFMLHFLHVWIYIQATISQSLTANETGRDFQLPSRFGETEAQKYESPFASCKVLLFLPPKPSSFAWSKLPLKHWEGHSGEVILDLQKKNNPYLVIVFIASQWSVKCSKRRHKTISFDAKLSQGLTASQFPGHSLCPGIGMLLRWLEQKKKKPTN